MLGERGRRSNSARRSSDGGMTDYLMDPLAGGQHHAAHAGRSQSSTRYGDAQQQQHRMLSRGLSYDLERTLAGGSLSSAGHHSAGHSASLAAGKGSMAGSSRKPRSWHPSPHGSDDELLDPEDDIITREAKKQRIKAEIARRRQQIEQNSRLHDELLRLARLRETGDVSAIPVVLFLLFIAWACLNPTRHSFR